MFKKFHLYILLLLSSSYAIDIVSTSQPNDVIEHSSKSVVNITAVGQTPISASNDPSHMPPSDKFESLGSGVIIDAKNGLINTNEHVIAHANLIFVTLHDGTKLYAHLVGKDAETDLALIAVKHPDLDEIKIADPSKPLHLGEQVIAVGNPFGLDNTITSGIISGLNRSIPPSENMIQTDAPINPGNSGGALVNQKGELIGICSSITTYSGGNIGIGFAAPLEMIIPIVNQLKQFGSVSRARIGLMIQDLTPPLMRALSVSPTNGILVSDVVPNSPAANADIKPEDIITSFNDTKISTSNQLRALVGTVKKGNKLSLTLIRGKETQTKTVELSDPSEAKPVLSNGIDGAELIEYEQLDNTGIIKGLYVINVNEGSPAFLTGLLPQDLILEIDHQPVNSLKSLMDRLKKQSNGESLLKVRRHNHFIFLALR